MARADFLPRHADPMRDAEWCQAWARYVTGLEMMQRDLVIINGTPYERGSDKRWRKAKSDNGAPVSCRSLLQVP